MLGQGGIGHRVNLCPQGKLGVGTDLARAAG